MHNLVTQLQMQSHSKTCKKKNTACRFHFPKPPSPQTILAHSLAIEDNPAKVNTISLILQLDYEAMLNWNLTEPLTLDALLIHTGVSAEDYLEVLAMSSKLHMVILERQPNEIFINNYNCYMLPT